MRKDRLDGQVANADEPRRQILRHSDHATGIRQIHPSSHSGRTRPRVLAAVLAMMLATIDHYTTQITELTAKIEALVAPYLHQVAQLDAVPGIGTVCAQDIIAEIGTDMTVFPTCGCRKPVLPGRMLR
jgi:transposase